MHHGENLKYQIKNSGKTVKYYTDLLGISRQTIYDWYVLERIDLETISRLKKVGLNPEAEPRQMSDSKNASNESIRLKMENDILRMENESLKGINEQLKNIIEELKRTNNKAKQKG